MSEQTQPIEEVVEETVQETKTVEETPQKDTSYKEVTKDGTIKLDLGKLKDFQTQNEMLQYIVSNTPFKDNVSNVMFSGNKHNLSLV